MNGSGGGGISLSSPRFDGGGGGATLILLSFLRQITAFSKWSWAITDRLSFVQVLSDTSSGITSSEEVYKTFKFSENDLLSLEDYLKEYFSNMLKRLRELNYDQELVNKRKDLTF